MKFVGLEVDGVVGVDVVDGVNGVDGAEVGVGGRGCMAAQLHCSDGQ
jgi:hypothetical protein